jgi:hypothetical protein
MVEIGITGFKLQKEGSLIKKKNSHLLYMFWGFFGGLGWGPGV